MPGRIRILVDKIDEVVSRKSGENSHQYGFSKEAIQNNDRCQCGVCKKFYPWSKYRYPGKTFRKQIEKSLEGMEYTEEQQGEYYVYSW